MTKQLLQPGKEILF